MKQQKTEAIQALRGQFNLRPGDTVWTTMRGVARSGMTRWLDLYVIRDGEPLRITWAAAHACGFTYDRKREALKIGGCGMDMGFHAVETLSRALFPEGFDCLGKGAEWADRCPSNDHSNGDRDYTPHHHKSGGYALRHRWL